MTNEYDAAPLAEPLNEYCDCVLPVALRELDEIVVLALELPDSVDDPLKVRFADPVALKLSLTPFTATLTSIAPDELNVELPVAEPLVCVSPETRLKLELPELVPVIAKLPEPEAEYAYASDTDPFAWRVEVYPPLDVVASPRVNVPL
jgi:hypothetical protein